MSATQDRTRRRRHGGGRAARVAARASGEGARRAVWPGLEGGRYRPLSERGIARVHDAALTVLARTGLADATEELLEIVLPKGAELNEHGRLCFPRALMEDIIAGAASEYVVHARGSRKGRDDMEVGGKRVYFANSGTAVTTFDAETRSYRPSTLADIYDFSRLVDRLEHIHMIGDTVLATDVPEDFEHDINTIYALLAGSEKPACLSLRSRDHIAPAIELFDLASGGEGRFLREPSVIFGGCPIVSPLRFARDNLEILIETSRLGLTSDIAVPPQAGATGPAPLAGTLVQSIAETLACLAVVNLVRPGCAMTFAAWPFIADLRTGGFTGGSGEQALIAAAAVQVGNHYGLPTSVGAGMTDAKIPDAQYGIEKALSYALAAHAGANRICEFGGMLGSLMGCGFEAMVIDDEIAGMILRTLRGIEVSDDTLSVETIHACAIDPGHFLGAPQTLEYMETEFVYPALLDRERIDTWEGAGKLDLFERARARSAEILAGHFPNCFGAADAQARSRFAIRLPRSRMAPA